MKRWLLLLLFASFILINGVAQDYYYSGGKRIPLTVDSTKTVIVSPLLEENAELSALSTKALRTIFDKHFKIQIFHDNEIESMGLQKKPKKTVRQCSIMPCYMNSQGNTLTPNGYLFVKLKSSNDYKELEKIADGLGCTIQSQDEYMPLWYTLRIIPGEETNSVEIANKIYETGKFASAFPSFSANHEEIF